MELPSASERANIIGISVSRINKYSQSGMTGIIKNLHPSVYGREPEHSPVNWSKEWRILSFFKQEGSTVDTTQVTGKIDIEKNSVLDSIMEQQGGIEIEGKDLFPQLDVSFTTKEATSSSGWWTTKNIALVTISGAVTLVVITGVGSYLLVQHRKRIAFSRLRFDNPVYTDTTEDIERVNRLNNCLISFLIRLGVYSFFTATYHRLSEFWSNAT